MANSMKFNVPSIACDACAKTISEGIHTHEPEAKVNVDVAGKTVSVETEASPESIKQMITAVGHKVE
ncbi:heavy-metal-associated domain-containing protein [Coleofasciculus sp. G1-WW12-02]|uniref:heavy-metal-associated domain-containing protein n=1 Tax=unclassified Coleofasciculus TaxID=2692782 RepID=UPI003300D94C